MRVINNQAEFDTMFVSNLANLPTDEIIRIMYNPLGYNVLAPIKITKSNVIIQGYGFFRPKLRYMGGDAASATGILDFTGTSGNELEHIRVEHLDLDGVDKIKTNVNGIYCNYCGKAQTAGLSSGGYDSTTVGIGGVNKIGATIKDCICQNNSTSGIYLFNSSNNTTIGNTLQNNRKDGIYLSASSNNNTVTGNTSQNNGDSGIHLYKSNNNTVTGNTSQNNGDSGIYLRNYSNNNTVTGNTSQNNLYGIYLNSLSDNNTVTGNTSQNNGDSGIWLLNSGCNTITANTFQNNSSNGIRLNGSNFNIVLSNTITQATGAHISEAGSYQLILGNIMIGTGTGINSIGANAKVVDNIKV